VRLHSARPLINVLAVTQLINVRTDPPSRGIAVDFTEQRVFDAKSTKKVGDL